MVIPLFYPNVSKASINASSKVLEGKWIGQGPLVKKFESDFESKFNLKHAVSLNYGTSALEMAYHLLGLKSGDEVISPVFTCTATNIPLIRRGIKIIFADVTDELLMDFDDVKRKITKKTRAIINVHLFGKYNRAPKLSVPIIGDSAQYLNKTDGELFTAYSFQATKIMTTVDGGMLVCKKGHDYQRAKLLRWYGIDRGSSKENIDVDIKEAGFMYSMNDVTASLGIQGLKELDGLKKHRSNLQSVYKKLIGGFGGSPYLVYVDNRDYVRRKLFENGVESGLVHKRNDVYSVFGGRVKLPNMDRLENRYLFLPCHNHMTVRDVKYICGVINKL